MPRLINNRRPHIFSFLIFAIFCFIIFLLIGGRNNYESVYLTQSAKENKHENSDQIVHAQKFLKDFSEGYVNTINEFFPIDNIWDSLPVGKPNKCKTQLYLSNSRDTYIHLQRNKTSILEVFVTDLPIQIALFHGLELFPTYNKITASVPEIIRFSDTCLYWGRLNVWYSYFNSGVIEMHEPYGKPFSINPKSVCVFENTEFICVTSDYKNVHQKEGMELLFGTTIIDSLFKSGEEIGAETAVTDVQKLIMHSDYFKKIASDSDLLKDDFFKYLNDSTLSKNGGTPRARREFDEKFSKIYKKASYYMKDSGFVDRYYQHVTNRIYFARNLLTLYNTFQEYTFQFCIAILIPTLTFIFFKRLTTKITGLLQKAPHLIILGTYLWCLSKKPDFLPVWYLFFPTFLFLICLLWVSKIHPAKKANDVY